MKPILLAMLLSANSMSAAESATLASGAINAFGIELLRECGKPDANVLLSPYSIQNAFAMAYAGAERKTRSEMARVLHYPPQDSDLHGSLAALRLALEDVARKSAAAAEREKKWGGHFDPITLTVANRLFAQTGYEFRPSFLALVEDRYAAPLEALDFRRNSEEATRHINQWVEAQTRQRIRHLIPHGALDALTRLVLVNAIYLKAPWADPFKDSATQPQTFRLDAANVISVPTMMSTRTLGYAHRDGCTLLAIPYRGGDLQFLILLPDQGDGLAAVERNLIPSRLMDGVRLQRLEVRLYLPKFKLEPPTLDLAHALQTLGMKSAFDQPPGSANFDRMAPRRPNDYLCISAVFHKTFLNLDEQGTEATAATAIAMRVGSAPHEKPKPIEVRVDHPFLFAIQHRPSGACLFLGHVADPRPAASSQ